MSQPDLILYLETPEGGVDEIQLPWKWEICGRCDGHGASSGYLGAITREELYDDPEFAEDYMAGHYDRPCEFCSAGKVKTVDWGRMPPEHQEAYRAQLDEERADRETNRMERLMEGGWREENWYGE